MIVSQDGAGEHFQQMAYLSRVASAANAPTYSWADAAVDSGIVGGNRRDQLAETEAIATLALRVLRGERPDDIGAVTVLLAQAALIAGLLVQRTKRQRAEIELRGSQARRSESYDRIRHLGRRLLGEQEAERARVARELHDDISQQLAILSIELDGLRSDPPQDDSARRFSRALETVQSISTSVRELSYRLHPSRLQLIGLVAAIDNLRRDFSPRHLSVAFSHRDVPAAIDPGVALCLYRVAQEARGFVADSVSRAGLGLISMRERVESVGGTLEIHARPATGTRLTVTIPTHASTQITDDVPS